MNFAHNLDNIDDTKTNEKCPHCGAEPESNLKIVYSCGSRVTSDLDDIFRSPLCHERSARQKLEAEVARLESSLRRAVEIAEAALEVCGYPDFVEHNRSELDAIKATLNPETK